MATGAEGASIVVVVHGHRIELDLSGFHNAPPEQQSALSSHRPWRVMLPRSESRSRLWARSECLRSVTVGDQYVPSAWNVSWDGLPACPSAASAISALIVPSVQLARVLQEAVLLVNGRSAVRSRSPAPCPEVDDSPLTCVNSRKRGRPMAQPASAQSRINTTAERSRLQPPARRIPPSPVVIPVQTVWCVRSAEPGERCGRPQPVVDSYQVIRGGLVPPARCDPRPGWGLAGDRWSIRQVRTCRRRCRTG
jgi:hypothetical protein